MTTPYLGTDLVSGGWNAIDNILTYGTAFPEAQRTTVRSETVQAAGGTGWTYRPTAPENQSMIESSQWAAQGWTGSPYEENMSVGVKTRESQAVAAKLEPQGDPLGEGLDWAMSQVSKVTTLWDSLSGLWESREVTTETPRAGSPEGKDVRHQNSVIEKGAEAIKAGTAWVTGIYDQVKGLFNLGFDQTGKQPVFSIQHELEPQMKIGLGVIVAVVVLLLILRKR